jgi:hypothetical protein
MSLWPTMVSLTTFSARSASAWPSLGGVGLASFTISLRSAMGAAEGTSDVAFFRGAVVEGRGLGGRSLGRGGSRGRFGSSSFGVRLRLLWLWLGLPLWFKLGLRLRLRLGLRRGGRLLRVRRLGGLGRGRFRPHDALLELLNPALQSVDTGAEYECGSRRGGGDAFGQRCNYLVPRVVALYRFRGDSAELFQQDCDDVQDILWNVQDA